MIFLYPEVRCPVEIITMVVVLNCLTSLWLVFGRGWWLIRTGLASLAIAALLPIGAYQPIVGFVVSTLATIPLLILLLKLVDFLFVQRMEAN